MNTSKIIFLPKYEDHRGDLSFIENNNQIPFKIKRTCLINNINFRASISEYAFIRTKQFILALSGNLKIILNDGEKDYRYSLNNPSQGLYVPNLLWIKTFKFSPKSLVLITSSELYDDNDSLRDFSCFKTLRDQKKY